MQVAVKKLSLKTQTIYMLCAVILAVIVPQLFHWMGAVSGLGTALGEAFLPMHLPVMLVGLLAGPYAGAVAGLLGPAASFMFSGMPSPVLLPFMMLELCFYGLTTGMLKNVKMPVFTKVLASQVAGRAVRALAIVLAVYVFKNSPINVSVIWLSIGKGIFGLVLQWSLLPLIAYRIEN